jgi:hypothetical protein
VREIRADEGVVGGELDGALQEAQPLLRHPLLAVVAAEPSMRPLVVGLQLQRSIPLGQRLLVLAL